MLTSLVMLVWVMEVIEVRGILQMRVAGVFDEGDAQHAEVFSRAVEDVNSNR